MSDWWSQRKLSSGSAVKLALPASGQEVSSLEWAVSPADGFVRKIVSPLARSNPRRSVLLIQDVHRDSVAQFAISNLLSRLAASRSLDLVALEGAVGPVGLPSDAKDAHGARPGAFPKTDRYLLENGKISGAAHAALNFPGKFPVVVGVDDVFHYEAHLAAYRQSAPLARSAASKLREARRVLELEKKSGLNPALRAFERRVALHRSGRTPLGDYAEFLRSQPFAEKSLTVYARAARAENSIDSGAAEAERIKLIRKLSARLEPRRLAGLLREMLSIRLGRVKAGELERIIADACGAAGIDLSEYPAFRKFLAVHALAESIDADALLKSIRDQENRIFAALARSPGEIALLRSSRLLELSAKLVAFSLSPAEWNEYESFDSAGKKGLPDLTAFEAFYREAAIRDARMAENLLEEMNRRGAVRAALVAGGYHSPGLIRRFADAGIEVTAVSPKIGRMDISGASAYLTAFQQDKTPLENLFEASRLTIAQNPFEALDNGSRWVIAAAESAAEAPRKNLKSAAFQTLSASGRAFRSLRVRRFAGRSAGVSITVSPQRGHPVTTEVEFDEGPEGAIRDVRSYPDSSFLSFNLNHVRAAFLYGAWIGAAGLAVLLSSVLLTARQSPEIFAASAAIFGIAFALIGPWYAAFYYRQYRTILSVRARFMEERSHWSSARYPEGIEILSQYFAAHNSEDLQGRSLQVTINENLPPFVAARTQVSWNRIDMEFQPWVAQAAHSLSYSEIADPGERASVLEALSTILDHESWRITCSNPHTHTLFAFLPFLQTPWIYITKRFHRRDSYDLGGRIGVPPGDIRAYETGKQDGTVLAGSLTLSGKQAERLLSQGHRFAWGSSSDPQPLELGAPGLSGLIDSYRHILGTPGARTLLLGTALRNSTDPHADILSLLKRQIQYALVDDAAALEDAAPIFAEINRLAEERDLAVEDEEKLKVLLSAVGLIKGIVNQLHLSQGYFSKNMDELFEQFPEELERLVEFQRRYPPALASYGGTAVRENEWDFQAAAEMGGLHPYQITGGGPGLMTAALVGNRKVFGDAGMRLGSAIRLPFEEAENEYLTAFVRFNIFVIRKLGLMSHTAGQAFFRGGWGTWDELFCALRKKLPSALVGREYWGDILSAVNQAAAAEGMPAPLPGPDALIVTDNVHEAWDFLKQRYQDDSRDLTTEQAEAFRKEAIESVRSLTALDPAVVLTGGAHMLRGDPRYALWRAQIRDLLLKGIAVRIVEGRGPLLRIAAEAAESCGRIDLLQALVMEVSPGNEKALELYPHVLRFSWPEAHDLAFSENAHAYLFLPGDVTTLAQFCLIVCLMKTGKTGHRPLVLSGSHFWQPIKSALVRQGQGSDRLSRVIPIGSENMLRIADEPAQIEHALRKVSPREGKDEMYMAMALQEARKARKERTWMSARVGAVLVSQSDARSGNSAVLARAYNRGNHQLHAEHFAIMEALRSEALRRQRIDLVERIRMVEDHSLLHLGRENFQDLFRSASRELKNINEALDNVLENATLYLSMEPCTKCAELLTVVGIRTIVYATEKPGTQGSPILLQRGFEVRRGVLEKEARRANRGYIFSKAVLGEREYSFAQKLRKILRRMRQRAYLRMAPWFGINPGTILHPSAVTGSGFDPFTRIVTAKNKRNWESGPLREFGIVSPKDVVDLLPWVTADVHATVHVRKSKSSNEITHRVHLQLFRESQETKKEERLFSLTLQRDPDRVNSAWLLRWSGALGKGEWLTRRLLPSLHQMGYDEVRVRLSELKPGQKDALRYAGFYEDPDDPGNMIHYASPSTRSRSSLKFALAAPLLPLEASGDHMAIALFLGLTFLAARPAMVESWSRILDSIRIIVKKRHQSDPFEDGVSEVQVQDSVLPAIDLPGIASFDRPVLRPSASRGIPSGKNLLEILLRLIEMRFPSPTVSGRQTEVERFGPQLASKTLVLERYVDRDNRAEVLRLAESVEAARRKRGARPDAPRVLLRLIPIEPGLDLSDIVKGPWIFVRQPQSSLTLEWLENDFRAWLAEAGGGSWTMDDVTLVVGLAGPYGLSGPWIERMSRSEIYRRAAIRAAENLPPVGLQDYLEILDAARLIARQA